jgi:DNA-binding transcriptional regulator YdaS (Cro superfamily)
MTLYEYFLEKPMGARAEMARLLQISTTWMSRLSNGKSKPSPYLAIQIEKITQGAVKRKDLLPEIFGK